MISRPRRGQATYSAPSAAAPIQSNPDQLVNIKVKVGIPKLMDALFAVEEALFTERRGPSLDSDVEPFDNNLFTAA